MRLRRGAALLGAALLAVAPAALASAAPAAAQTAPPFVSPGAPGELPAPTRPVPDPAAMQKTACLVGSADTTAAITQQPWAQTQLDFEKAWSFGRGAGQKIAVIDTGVNPVPRLTVAPGGDYVSAPGDGTTDCDGHGTIVASIIGAKPDLAADPTGYAGVAPDATILSIRQYSANYETTTGKGTDSTGKPLTGQPGDLKTLAQSIVWAAESGATVINISEAACGSTSTGLGEDAEVGAALRYAVDVKDVVVVVAAGNVDSGASSTCQANASDGVTPPVTAVSPAWWDDYVLAVGSVDEQGAPSEFTLAGPWVDVAAPGEGIVSLNPVAGPPLINTIGASTGGEPPPIRGTSFATPYVAGTVALVRERFKDLDARQVMARIEATAHAPAGGTNELVGHGVIDPVAAVTDLPAELTPQALDASTTAFVVPAPVPAASTTPRTVAFVGSAIALGSVLATFAVLHAVQRSRRRSA